MIAFLNEKFQIILEHGTDVPGLADGLKHLDGFISLTEKLGFIFYKKSFSASRSAIDGPLDPIQSLGLDKAISELSNEATILLKNSQSLNYSADFNQIVTGAKDVSEAALIIKKVGLEGLVDGITDRLVNLIIGNTSGEQLSEIKKREMLENISAFGTTTIVVKLFVNRMDVVGQLCTSNKRFITTCKNNFLAVAQDQLYLGKKNVVIHYRLGDTAIFPLPNGKFIAAWGDWKRSPSKTSAPEILDSPEEAVYKPIDFSLTINTIKLATINSPKPFSLTLLSDGYERGIDRIIEFRHQLNIMDSDIEFIKEWAESKKNLFIENLESQFKSNNVKIDIFWGETNTSFMESVTSIAKADILFIGVGGFSKAIFNIYNLKDNSIILGPTKEENSLWVKDKVKTILCS